MEYAEQQIRWQVKEKQKQMSEQALLEQEEKAGRKEDRKKKNVRNN